ncbi:MAG: Uma2 family endonuclease [Planctomycetes bacterium]|nr:Uma2 family endonuclease [Planctomycetota bacterium]
MHPRAELQKDDRPTEDHAVRLSGVTWADYERLLEIRGEAAVPRLTFLEGELEIMSPSRDHERLKSTIGSLVEVYCLHQGLRFTCYGSWTLKDPRTKRGAEPDECYVLGDVRWAAVASGRPAAADACEWQDSRLVRHRSRGTELAKAGHTDDAERPHLAIEVVWTSGGLDKLEVYRKLGVQEVWTWRKGRILVHALRGDCYEGLARSELLPGLDLEQLTSFLDRPTTFDAIRDYRAALG